ncbi:MAG TPA: peroxiredoxin-like family protein [Gaiellaceae bacterium]|nr:peroxiredoxin-like family protein [Gaiellaceae bacterium]
MSEFSGLDREAAERIVAQVAAAQVLALDGRVHRLRDLWRGVPNVTTFVRHFGCLFCHQMVNELVTRIPEIVGRGARVVIIGNGTLEQARHFFSERKLPRSGVDVVTDPRRESYAAAGLERGLFRTFNGSSATAYRAARARGHRVTGLFGDLTQLGGLFVIQPPATLVYAHRSRFAGDHPDMTDVLRHV